MLVSAETLAALDDRLDRLVNLDLGQRGGASGSAAPCLYALTPGFRAIG